MVVSALRTGRLYPLIFTRGMVWSEKSVTPPGIDPETVRLVAQRLNHYATPGPSFMYNKLKEGSVTSCVRNCLLRQVIQGRMGRQGRRYKQLWDDLEGMRRYWKLKEATLDYTLGELALEEAVDVL